MDDRRLAKARAQNPAYRPAHPLNNPLTWSEGLLKKPPGHFRGTCAHQRKPDSAAWSSLTLALPLLPAWTPVGWRERQKGGPLNPGKSWSRGRL